MRDLGYVIANEWMKLIRKKRLWVTLLLGIIVVVGLSSLMYLSNNYNGLDSAKQQLQYLQEELDREQGTNVPDQEIKDLKQQIKDTQQQISEMEQLEKGNWRPIAEQRLKEIKDRTSDDQVQEYDKQEMLKLQYHLDHNIKLYPDWKQSAYQNTANLISFTAAIFLPMLVVILIADMMSGETTSGTIKLLLVRPISRTTILFGKWFVSILATAVLSLCFLLALWGINLAFYGFGGGLEPQIVGMHYTFKTVFSEGIASLQTIPHFEHVALIPAYQFIIGSILLATLAMLTVASLSFLCSTLFKSSMVSTGVAFAFIIIGTIVGQVLNSGKYLFWLFSIHLNLMGNWTGQLSKGYHMNMPLSFGVIVLIIWALVTLIIAIFYFRKKDIFNA